MIGPALWVRRVLFPPKCMLCGRLLRHEEGDLCTPCREKAPIYPYSAAKPAPKGKISLHFLDSFTAVWYYGGDVRRSIHRFKFHHWVSLAPRFGRVTAQKLLEQGPTDYDILTWVPISAKRRRKRGFDQCELLAKAVGEKLGREPVCILKKIRDTPAQSGRATVEERKANVLGAYTVCSTESVQGKVILILDDVYTTGATMEECARVLLTAGAKEVHGAAIAAVSPRNKRPSR